MSLLHETKFLDFFSHFVVNCVYTDAYSPIDEFSTESSVDENVY
jgi:hypothetical protein